jgi:two-component system response regulator FixJ
MLDSAGLDSPLNASRPHIGNIAIVDDDEPLREALGSVLKAAGFLAAGFSSAEEFLESADWRSTRCLILDVRLPGMSGVELQRRLTDADSTIPIIFMTGHGDASLRDVLMNAGASAFLNKPVRRDALLNEIYAALKKNPAN